jgi:hypothetical protein
MKFKSILAIGITSILTLSSCSSQFNQTFMKLDKDTADFCSKFKKVNEEGKQFSVIKYSIKTVEMDDDGKTIETSKIVNCDAENS